MTAVPVRDVTLSVNVVGHGYPVLLMHGGPGADQWTLLEAMTPALREERAPSGPTPRRSRCLVGRTRAESALIIDSAGFVPSLGVTFVARTPRPSMQDQLACRR